MLIGEIFVVFLKKLWFETIDELFFSQVFHILRPAKAPGFAYAWLELISHRVFIGRLLALTPHQRVRKTYLGSTVCLSFISFESLNSPSLCTFDLFVFVGRDCHSGQQIKVYLYYSIVVQVESIALIICTFS